MPTRNLKSLIINLKSSIKNGAGFTLVELIIVIAILGAFLIAAVAIINPFAQFNKANNARIQSDLTQIRTALDTYYNDTGCYPASIPFGSQWSKGNIYLPPFG